jgi:DNA (cytosine-5)-methyltransferase 1
LKSAPPNGTKSADAWIDFVFSSKPRDLISAKQFSFIDLFSSIGGLTTGFAESIRDQGLAPRSLFAADVDVLATQVYKANWPTAETYPNSVRNLVDSKVDGSGEGARFVYEPKIVHPDLASFLGKVNAVIAGPPCQGNSNLNNKTRGDDPRNELYLQVPAIAVALGADKVLIENVPGVVREKNNVVGTTISLLEAAGYKVESGLLSADQFGWPQSRKRFFIVADKLNAPLPFRDLIDQYGQSPQSIEWLLSHKVESDSDLMSQGANLSDENQRRADFLMQNDLFDLPLEHRPDCHKGGTTYTSSYGRLRPGLPAPTLTTGFMSPGRGRFIHPFEPRTLTPREGALVQGFPNWYVFNPDGATSRNNLAKWIGDAVPPVLGHMAGKSFVF